MAALYVLSTGTLDDKKSFRVLGKLTLIDEGSEGEWKTGVLRAATIGAGHGLWIRQSSTSSIILNAPDWFTKEGVLSYERWPLKKGSTGIITLQRPIRGSYETVLHYRVEKGRDA